MGSTSDDGGNGPWPAHPAPGPVSAQAGAGTFKLRLLGGFRLLRHGQPVRLARSCQRLVAHVALQPGHERSYVASALWPEAPEQRALASLRSTLWRLQAQGVPLDTEGSFVRLPPSTEVDVHRLQSALAPEGSALDATAGWSTGGAELLPDWYEDWVFVQRERLRQLRLHSGEAAAERLCAQGRYGDALQVALQLVAWEPLRESAQRLVVRIHLAEGNANEALRQFHGYQALLQQELGLTPGPQMLRLVAPLPLQRSPAPG